MHDTTIQAGRTDDGTWTYLVARPPEALPPVLPRDLELAWDAARRAALAVRFGKKRLFRFQRQDGSVTDLALTDRARCWAKAVAVSPGIGALTGLSLCLRLLALVDLLSRASWAAVMVRRCGDGAEIDAALLRLAATAPLTREARFDETMLRTQLAQASSWQPRLSSPASGA